MKVISQIEKISPSSSAVGGIKKVSYFSAFFLSFIYCFFVADVCYIKYIRSYQINMIDCKCQSSLI
jgi:hypothetical protein